MKPMCINQFRNQGPQGLRFRLYREVFLHVVMCVRSIGQHFRERRGPELRELPISWKWTIERASFTPKPERAAPFLNMFRNCVPCTIKTSRVTLCNHNYLAPAHLRYLTPKAGDPRHFDLGSVFLKSSVLPSYGVS